MLSNSLAARLAGTAGWRAPDSCWRCTRRWSSGRPWRSPAPRWRPWGDSAAPRPARARTLEWEDKADVKNLWSPDSFELLIRGVEESIKKSKHNFESYGFHMISRVYTKFQGVRGSLPICTNGCVKINIPLFSKVNTKFLDQKYSLHAYIIYQSTSVACIWCLVSAFGDYWADMLFLPSSWRRWCSWEGPPLTWGRWGVPCCWLGSCSADKHTHTHTHTHTDTYVIEFG